MLYLSRVINVREDIKYYDLHNILNPSKSLIIFNEGFRSFYICLISDKNLSTIKFKNRNKWNIILFDKIKEPLFHLTDIKNNYKYLLPSDEVLEFIINHDENVGFIIKQEESYHYHSVWWSNIINTELFYRTLENSITV